MKTLKQFFNVVTICVAGLFVFASCTVGPNEENKAPVTPFSITYSTGEATWSETNPETLALNKLGVGTTGTIPYLEVTSSVYWTVDVVYGEGDEGGWLSVSPLGGPNPSEMRTNVYLDLTENKGEDRFATIKFKTQSKTYEVDVLQRGPLTNPLESTLLFLDDDFGGDVLDKDIKVKFYPFTNADGSRTYDGIATSGGTFAYAYAGSDNAKVSKADASKGYEDVVYSRGASGGANVMLDGKSSYFEINNFGNSGKTDFHLSFGAKNCDGKFRTSDLVLSISADRKKWEKMDYVHSSHPTNDWSINTFDFSIAPNVSDILYFRFENTSEDLYRIDDLFIVESEPSENLFPLIEVGADIQGLPVNFRFNDLTADGVKGIQWCTNGTILNEESGAYIDGEEAVEFNTAALSAASVQFIVGTEESLVKRRLQNDGMLVTSNSPKVTGFFEGDYWLWTIPVSNAKAMTNVGVDMAFWNRAAGPKYYVLEYAQCTRDEYGLPLTMPVHLLTDEEKNEFYNTLDWTVWHPMEVTVPMEIGFIGENNSATENGIPMGSSIDPVGYWKGTIQYSEYFYGPFGDVETKIRPENCVVTFPDAMDEGFYFLRMRCTSNITAGETNRPTKEEDLIKYADVIGYQRMNKATHNGTTYLRQTAAFTFVNCGGVIESDGGYKFLTIFKDIENYGGGAIKYSNGSRAGLYAGHTPNIESSTFGSNLFSGVCNNEEELGRKAVVYGPYNENNTSDLTSVLLEIPAEQKITDGTLLADALPVLMSNTTEFKTARVMRCDMQTVSSVAALNIYSNESISDKISQIILRGNGIAGSHTFNAETLEDNGENVPASEIVASSNISFVISGDKSAPTMVYIPIWAGNHSLDIEIHAGRNVYSGTLAATDFVAGHAVDVEVCVDELQAKDVDAEVKPAIDSAAKFLEFVTAISEGATGEELDAYRNEDGDFGFGGAADGAEKVIDMAGVNMKDWPQVVLKENFNGANYTIKNLIINNPNVSLFRNIEYGCTISNIIFDESCKLNVNIEAPDPTQPASATSYDESVGNQYWSFLLNQGSIDESGASHESVGSIYNVVNYGAIDIYGAHPDVNVFVGAVLGRASAGASDAATMSTITYCKNHGKISIHDLTQSDYYSKTNPWYRYTTIGGLVGENAGFVISNCENHGEISVENVKRNYGAFFIGGLVGYNANRVDSNASIKFGLVTESANYGEINVGQGSDVQIYSMALTGCVGRSQWGNMSRLTNYADITVKVKIYDPFPTYDRDWATQIGATTNSWTYCNVAGILGFAQNNVATGIDNTLCRNYGNIYVECDQEGTVTPADNVGPCVGGIMGMMGANAYNPRFANCTNEGDITLKSNVTSAHAHVGGIMGKLAANRNDQYSAYSIKGCANTGKVTFLTDNPETTIAHVGGVVGETLYGLLSGDINVGEVSNASTNEASTVGSILGYQKATQIKAISGTDPKATIENCGVGGSVNGVVITKENFSQYVYQKSDNEVYLNPEMENSFIAL